MTKWQPIETRPKDSPKAHVSSYLVANAKGQVAPYIRGIIANNPGTKWDWDWAEKPTHWMPLPDPPEDYK